MDEMIYRDFENKIQKLSAKVIISLDEEGNWSCINNIREGNQFECDVLIEKEERPFAAVEIKYADQAFQSGVRHALRIASYFKTPYIFVVTKNKFAYLTADGKIIKMHNESITGSDIRKCLTSLGLLRFDSEHWDGKINDLIKKIESSEDDIVRERSEKICEALEHMKFQDVTVAQEEFKVEVKPEIETALFSALLGDYIKEDVCRFISFPSLFRTVNDVKHSMCSIVAMNDKSETSYVDNYMRDQNFSGLQYIESGPDEWNNCFITSCCDEDRLDDLTMMRLYADDARGAAILYNIKLPLPPDFILRPVSYQRDDGSHPELDILIELLSINEANCSLSLPSFNRWKHFFKPKEYEFEKEVRLLYISPTLEGNTSDGITKKWILNQEFNIITPLVEFSIKEAENKCPLLIKKVLLGAKMREDEINCQQLESLFKIKSIANGANIIISISSVNNYR